MDIEKSKRKSTNSHKANELDETYKTRVDESNTHKSGEILPSKPQRAICWLKKIAESGGIQSIKNPITWQKNLRKDRSLSLD